jgi:CRP/FNR family transcriptional regulator, anaerobic regulatory protein
MSDPAQKPPFPSPPAAPVVSIGSLRSHCATCNMRTLCLPVGLAERDLASLDSLLGNRLRLKKGEPLFRNGAPFTSLYAVWLGSLKTTVLSDDGREQVAGYHMPGDLLGLDGMGGDHHGCEATALEDAELCVLPFSRIEDLARDVPALQHNLHKILSREIERDHKVMLLLGSMRAEERLAAFLLNLSERYRSRGYSSTEFVLRMTREEIGSYLGLKLETVSRLFSRFQDEGLVTVAGRSVRINDLSLLKQLVGRG